MAAVDPRLLRRARPARVLLGVEVAIGICATLLILLQATLLARIVARAFSGAGLEQLTGEIVLLAVLFAARGLLAWQFEAVGRRGASRVLSTLRCELVERRLRAQPAGLDGVEGGEISAAGVGGLEALEAYFGRYLPQLVLGCLVPIAVLAWVAPVDLTSALIMLLTLPLIPVFMWLIGHATQRRTRRSWAALRLLSNHFLDVVRGLPTLRAFNRGRPQIDKIGEVSEAHRRATMGTLRVSFLSGSVLELAATLGVALVAVTIGIRLVNGGIGLEAGLTVLVLAPELYLPLRRVGAEYHASADGVAVAERLLGLLGAPAEAPRGRATRPPNPAESPIRLESVSYRYPSRDGLVLDGLELEIEPRETLVLIGESGAGKSTVALLLLGLAAPSAGRLTVADVPLDSLDIQAWRRQVGWVPQRPTLLAGTVAENIRMGDASVPDEEVRRAARLAAAEGFIGGLPHGYETVIGDGGRSLSAGEKRRLALARAFLRDAPFLILDEPTADLDPETGALVAEALENQRHRRTVLLIAHRPEILTGADRVVALGSGRLEAVERPVAVVAAA